MKTIAALLVCLAIRSTFGAECPNLVTCPCGTKGENVTVCSQATDSAEICTGLSKCETCEGGSDVCSKCPEGLKGPFCTKEVTGKIKKKRQSRNYGRRSTRPPMRFCQDPGVDSNGSRQPRTPPSQRGFPQGTRLLYSCNQRYELSGEQNIFCLTSEEWTADRPQCLPEVTKKIKKKRQSGNYGRRPTRPSAKFCQDPGVDSNGNRQPRTPPSQRGFPRGSRLLYSCNEGYELNGERNTFCLASGEWSADRPQCLPEISHLSYCKYPGNIANGRMVHIPSLGPRRRPPSNGIHDRQEEYPEGSRLQYSCDEGYTLEGRGILTCRKTGNWAPAMPPTCVSDDIVNCNNPGPVLNGRVRYFAPGVQQSDSPGSSLDYELDEYPAGTVVEYYCDEGYRLHGSEVLTCQSTGIWTAEAPMCMGDCGRSLLQTGLWIRDGQKTMSGEWPWVVSISIEEGDTSRFICGGAVLSTRTIVTAAHCLEKGRTYILRFGKHHLRVEDDDPEVLIRRSNRVIIHPNYSDRTLDSDIGLIMFKSRIRYSVRVQPVCFPSPETTFRNTKAGTMGHVSGWGETEEGLPSDELLLSSLPVRSDQDCAESYRKQNLAVSITQNMFCAGYRNGSYSVCGGDSGSPFVFYDRVTERYTLEGLVSFAVRRRQDAQACGMEGRYPIFTKVVRFVPWIYQNMQ